VYRLSQTARCPVCGVEFRPTVRSLEGDVAEVMCPNGHIFTVSVPDSDLVLDCEIRDWERFVLLPQATQQAVIEVIHSGKVPNELQAPMRRLKEAGIVVCT
jgi:hypothetical protein